MSNTQKQPAELPDDVLWEWVPVSAKIPNMPRRALVVAVNDDGEAFVTTAHYNGRNGWLGMSGYTLLDVSHWMPLPEPPNADP